MKRGVSPMLVGTSAEIFRDPGRARRRGSHGATATERPALRSLWFKLPVVGIRTREAILTRTTGTLPSAAASYWASR
jgi:hypothetical protein